MWPTFQNDYCVQNCYEEDIECRSPLMIVQIGPDSIFIIRHFLGGDEGAYMVLLGSFPKNFSLVATSQLCNFPSGNFPSLSYPQCLAPQHALVAALGLHCNLRRLRGPNITFGKLLLGKLHIWEIVTWEVLLGKMTLE